MIVLLFPIHFFRIKHGLTDRPKPIRRENTVETGAVTRVTGRPSHLFNFQKDRVIVAVDVDFLDNLIMATFFSLPPEAISTATKIYGPTRCQRFGKALLVHIGEHEDFPRNSVLRDRWQDTVIPRKIGAPEHRILVIRLTALGHHHNSFFLTTTIVISVVQHLAEVGFPPVPIFCPPVDVETIHFN